MARFRGCSIPLVGRVCRGLLRAFKGVSSSQAVVLVQVCGRETRKRYAVHIFFSWTLAPTLELFR